MEHCLIDGKRCSKCCEVLTLAISANLISWVKHVRRFGYPDDFEGDKIYHMMIKISKRRAKKINPYLVKIIGKTKGRGYFKCKNFTGTGCGIYETRPRMCSKFPYYGKTKEEFLNDFNSNDNWKPEYREDCTYYIEVI